MELLARLVTANQPFSMLNKQQLSSMLDCVNHRRLRAGEFLSTYGEIWPYLFIVVEGTVEAIKESPEGRSLHVLTLCPGDIFWGMAFFVENMVSPVALQASKDCQIGFWHRSDLVPIMKQNCEALWSLSKTMITRMERASKILEGLAFQPVAARLASLLLDHYASSDGTPVARDLTLDELAARVGTTREMICRVLYRLSDQNLIEITRTEFTLTDKSGLAQIAKEDPPCTTE
jgi:CRP-like cAMP-binding protein